MPQPELSVVIPTLNEEESLAAAVQSVADADEIIVVDGGSSDRTVDLARDLGAQVLSTPACRGLQMAEGAALTRGEWILFLHADSRLEAGACAFIRTLDRNVVGGAFDLRFDDAQVVYRFLEGVIRLRTRALRLPYGDQAIFARRSAYEAAGGMPHLPLMEDVAFVRALGAVGQFAFPAIQAITSARRYERRGPLRSMAANLLLLARYFAGADPTTLARAYRPGSPW